ncbi:MAG TPA: transglycosylase SLT domain-containing protein [Candidatus Dormibacteraeota bacterium]|nr:transglycosylase SLT domain-containing protein [Candidatus Dormibacteraeota bacterium]
MQPLGRVLACALTLAALAAAACGGDPAPPIGGSPDQPLPPLNYSLNTDPGPAPAPAIDPNAPPLDLRITKSMLYAAAIEHGVNPNLVFGLAWWESGWNESAVSSAGAIGIMQIMPATADTAGPWLLHRKVDLTDINDNIELGCAIIRNNLDTYHGDLVKALTDYYGGPSLVTDWDHLRPDARRYVWGIYHLALAWQAGHGPV